MRPAQLALALALAGPLAAQEPAPKPGIDQTIDRIAELRAKRAELDKLEAAAVTDLRAQLKMLNDKIDKLGLAGPVPTPPVPPAPPAPPPAPVDPLKAKLKAAFEAAAGGTGEKRNWAKDLAALYTAAVEIAGDKELATATALKLKMADAGQRLMKGPDRLKEVRQVVAVELAGVLPTTESDLTDAQRAAAAALFTKLAALLDALAAE